MLNQIKCHRFMKAKPLCKMYSYLIRERLSQLLLQVN